MDRDEIIVAHMVGGVDAFIKVCQGWPVSNNALKLKSLKSSDQQSKGISLSFLCKVEVSFSNFFFLFLIVTDFLFLLPKDFNYVT